MGRCRVRRCLLKLVVTMGCGDACPLLPGKRYEDWELGHPSGKTIEEIRPIPDRIRDQVNDLLQRVIAQQRTCGQDLGCHVPSGL